MRAQVRELEFRVSKLAGDGLPHAAWSRRPFELEDKLRDG